MRRPLVTLLRSSIAGGAATAADLLVLAIGIFAFGLHPRVAGIPALIVGAVVNFYGNRHFAFRARSGALDRQVVLYAVTEGVALAFNALLYDAAVRVLHLSGGGAMVARLVTTNAVFLAWSFPVWRHVFRPVNTVPSSRLLTG